MGTRNTSLDLNNHLFEQLERLNDEDLTDDDLKKEVERSKAITSVSKAIIDNSKIVLTERISQKIREVEPNAKN